MIFICFTSETSVIPVRIIDLHYDIFPIFFSRTSEYYVDESLRNASEGNLFHRTGTNSGNYDSSSASQPESLKVENPEMEHANQYSFPSSAPGYAYENAQQLNIGFSQSQPSSQMQNLAPFSNVMVKVNYLSY